MLSSNQIYYLIPMLKKRFEIILCGKKGIFKMSRPKQRHILYSHIGRVIGLLPGRHWTLIIQDCMIYGVNSERTERSSEEMKRAR